MDVFLLTGIIQELAPRINGARINKIFQPNADEIVLHLWRGGESINLLLSASARFGRVQEITDKPPNPPAPPRFCQLLRARLSFIKELRQVPEERIVEVVCGGSDGHEYLLVLELLGTRTNLLLCDDSNQIIDTLKRVEDSVGRMLLPGQAYALPTSGKRLSLSDRLPSLDEIEAGRDDLRRWLLSHISPMSGTVAGMLAERSADPSQSAVLLKILQQDLLQQNFKAFIGEWNGKTVLVPFAFLAETLVHPLPFASVNEAVDQYYRQQLEDEGGAGLQRELQQVVGKVRGKLKKRLQQIQKEAASLERFEELKVKGELLLANLYRIKPGDKEVEVEDYYQSPPQPVTIALDTTLTPQENAEHYFSRYKKAKRGLPHIEERLRVTQDEFDWLDEMALGLEQAGSSADIEAVRQELQQAGHLRDSHYTPKGKPRPLNPKERLRKAITPGGFQLYWGRNNLTNDYVSKTMTDADDLWFHAHGCPGCHLVLKRGNWKGEIPEEDVLFAASLAAGYSHGKEDSKLEVMVAQGRHVNKPKGARPGLVIVPQFRTVLVRPIRQDD